MPHHGQRMNTDTAAWSWPDKIRHAAIAVLTAPSGSSWPRRVRNAAIALLILVVLVAIVGFLIVPPLAKSKLESYLSTATARKATLGKVAFNPFTLHASLTDFTLAEGASERALLHFDTLDLELSLATL